MVFRPFRYCVVPPTFAMLAAYLSMPMFLFVSVHASSSNHPSAEHGTSGGTSKSNTCEYGYPLHRLRVLLIRHGESENNVLHSQSLGTRYADPALTPRGVAQAEACASYLNGEGHEGSHHYNPIFGGIDAIYVSPMLRTIQTAVPIGRALKLNPNVWTDIHEISGVHENGVGKGGLTRSEMSKMILDQNIPDDVNEYGWYNISLNKGIRDVAIPRIRIVAERLFRMARECEEERKSRTIALVCHGNFKDILVQILLGLEVPIEKKKRFLSYNTAITALDLSAAQNHTSVLQQNFVGHLNKELITLEDLGKT